MSTLVYELHWPIQLIPYVKNSNQHIEPTYSTRRLGVILKWWYPAALLEELEGDLNEEYRENLKSSKFKAEWLYAKDSIAAVLRHWLWSFTNYLKQSIMISNYVKTSFRVMLRHKFYSVLNIVGLALGLSCCLLIFLFVNHETSYDKFHQKAEKLYRLNLGSIERGYGSYAKSSGAMAQVLLDNYPEIESAVRLRHFPSLVANGDTRFYEDKFFFVDSTMMTAFSWEVVAGNGPEALTQPNTLVITEEVAQKYFPNEPALGKQLSIDNVMNFEITAIVKSPPRNSHLDFDILASTMSIPTHHSEPLRTYQSHSWYAVYFYTYLLLKPGIDLENLELKLLDAPRLYSDPEQYELYGRRQGLYLQPLLDIHLDPVSAEITPQGNMTYVWIFSVIAVLILVVGCVNYLNLVTARASTRLKEIGLRKAIGASRANLKYQFAWESIIIGSLALVLAWVIVLLGLPLFNAITGKQFYFEDLLTLEFILASMGVVTLTTMIGGLYPAFYLAKFQAATAIKGDSAATGKAWIRKSVVVMQFSISVILIAATFLIHRQTSFMLSKDLGLNTDKVIVIPTRGVAELNNTYLSTLKHQLDVLPTVQSSAIGELSPGELGGGIIARFEGMAENRNFKTIIIGTDYLDTYGIELIAGRDFSEEIVEDTLENVIINETLANLMGWTPEEALGKKYDFGDDGINPGQVIGVTKDFHFRTLHTEIVPTVFSGNHRFLQKIAIKVKGDNLPEALVDIEEVWKGQLPQYPFEYYFADESLTQLYFNEKNFGRIFLTFSTLAISVALLGLIGLTAFFVEKRLKEFGIRKVLGATDSHLFVAFSRNVVQLLAVALVISSPLVIILGNRWLETFSYRISMSADIILLAAIISGLGCFVILIWQATRIIFSNPADVLRND